VRRVALAVALSLCLPVCAQEAQKKPAPKKKAALPQAAHQQPSKEQVRKFDELQKKQAK